MIMEFLQLFLVSVGVLIGCSLGKIFSKERDNSLKNLRIVCHGAFFVNLLILGIQSVIIALVIGVLYFFLPSTEVLMGLVLALVSSEFFLLSCMIGFIFCYATGAQIKEFQPCAVSFIFMFIPTMLRFVF